MIKLKSGSDYSFFFLIILQSCRAANFWTRYYIFFSLLFENGERVMYLI